MSLIVRLIEKILSFVFGLVAASLFMSACSSSPKTSQDVPLSDSAPLYQVRERYPNPAPEWTRNFADFARQNSVKGQHAYLGESGDVSDRIAGCDLADLDGKKKIAQQIASLITDTIASSKAGALVIDRDNPNDPDLKRHFENTVAAKSMAYLTGVRNEGMYWEERDYSQTGGRKRVYQCMSLITIADRDLEAAIKRVAQKTSDSADPDTKSAVKEALKNVDEQFKSFSGH